MRFTHGLFSNLLENDERMQGKGKVAANGQSRLERVCVRFTGMWQDASIRVCVRACKRACIGVSVRVCINAPIITNEHACVLPLTRSVVPICCVCWLRCEATDGGKRHTPPRDTLRERPKHRTDGAASDKPPLTTK
jgi:hypothetical protein